MKEEPLQSDGMVDAFSADQAHRRVAKPGPWRVFLSHTSELRQYPKPGESYLHRAERAVSAAGHAIVDMADLDYPQTSATLRSRSVSGTQQQTAFAIRSVIPAIEKRRLTRKQ